MNAKHAAPMYCKLRRTIFGTSPSLAGAVCGLGVKKCRFCPGCEMNRREQWTEPFEKEVKNDRRRRFRNEKKTG